VPYPDGSLLGGGQWVVKIDDPVDHGTQDRGNVADELRRPGIRPIQIFGIGGAQPHPYPRGGWLFPHQGLDGQMECTLRITLHDLADEVGILEQELRDRSSGSAGIGGDLRLIDASNDLDRRIESNHLLQPIRRLGDRKRTHYPPP